jgi:hypothetical protein
MGEGERAALQAVHVEEGQCGGQLVANWGQAACWREVRAHGRGGGLWINFSKSNFRPMNKRSQLAIVSGVAGAVLLSLNSCAYMLGAWMSTPTMKSTFAGNGPIMTTAQAVKGGDGLKGQVIQLYGTITQLGKHPRLDDAIDLIPGFGGDFKDVRIGQTILVRGFFKSERRQGMEVFKLTSAVWYPGIEKSHEAELAELRGER